MFQAALELSHHAVLQSVHIKHLVTLLSSSLALPRQPHTEIHTFFFNTNYFHLFFTTSYYIDYLEIMLQASFITLLQNFKRGVLKYDKGGIGF